MINVKKAQLVELKSLTNPPQRVVTICGAVNFVFDSNNKKIQACKEWKNIQKLMGNPSHLLQRCLTYDPAKFEKEKLLVLEKYMKTN